MSLRTALLEVLADPSRLETLASGAATDAEFVSRVVRAAGATWITETAHAADLLRELEQYNWRFGGVSPGSVFVGPDIDVALIGAVSTDRTWAQAYDLRIAATNYRPFRQVMSENLKTWRAPG